MNTDGVNERRGRGRGRGNRSRGRGRGRGRGGRGKKIMTRSPPEPAPEPEPEQSDEDVSMEQLDEESENYVDESTGTSSALTLEELTNDESFDNDADTSMANADTSMANDENELTVPTPIDMEADISQLEAPTFTTITRSPPEPMLRLKWDHKVNLIGEKVLNPMIHCCDQCDKPILVYGRMIPCKHVFCLKCARAEPVKICPRCKDKVIRVEQSGLGTVFMCTFGGSTYGNTGCRRTYLSQRDLQAHINHRHISQPMPTNIEQTNVKSLQLGEPKPTKQRKLSECSSPVSATSTTAVTAPPNRTQIKPAGAPTATLTVANVARINSGATMPDILHPLTKVNVQQATAGTTQAQNIQQQPTIPNETVADASYYSSVLNSYGNPSTNGSNTHPINPNFGQVSQASAHQSSPTNQPTQTVPVPSVSYTPQLPPSGAGGNQTPSGGFYPFGTQFAQVAPPNFNPNNPPPNNNQQQWNQQQFFR